MDDRHLGGELGEEEGLLHGRVSPAHDADLDLEHDTVLTERPWHAVELARTAAAEVDVVVAAGGDGYLTPEEPLLALDGSLPAGSYVTPIINSAEAVAAARFNSPELPVEVEVENLDELQQAMDARVERVLLDNFSVELLRQAVKLNNKQLQLEASGGVTLDSIRAIAETGVDFISTGALTKDLTAIDLSMRFATTG